MEGMWEIYNMKWIENFPNTKLECFPILGSDHSPVFVNSNLSIPFKPRPFRFECMWHGEQQRKQIISSVWARNEVDSIAFKVVKKLEGIKKELIMWNRGSFGNIRNRINSLTADLAKIQEELPQNPRIEKEK